MKKLFIEQFIAKYNLASGDVETAKWSVTDHFVSVRFTSADESCFGYVQSGIPELPNGDYYIANTSTLRSMLSVLGDDCTVTTKKNTAGVPISFLWMDKASKISFPLGDPALAKKHRNASAPVDPATTLISIPLTPTFVQSFLRARGALKDVETVTLASNGQTVEVIIGYETKGNSNRITLTPDASIINTMPHINYKSKYLAEIITANKDMPVGTLSVIHVEPSPPFLRIEFNSPTTNSIYIILRTME